MSNGKALVIVDMQHDFLPGGALGVPDGDTIIPGIVKIAKEYDFVVASQDWHPHDHCSFKEQGGEWPKHCVIGTLGALITDEIVNAVDAVIARKGMDKNVEQYSAVEALIGKEPMHKFLESFPEIDICGLALDYCVKHTALDFKDGGWETTVLLDLTRPVAWKTGMQAIADLRKLEVGLGVSRV